MKIYFSSYQKLTSYIMPLKQLHKFIKFKGVINYFDA